MAVELEQSAAFLEPILGAHQQACVVSSHSSVPPAAALRTHCAGCGGWVAEMGATAPPDEVPPLAASEQT